MLGSKLFRVPVISLVIFLTCSFGQTLSVDSREYAVDIISRNGLRVKFPFYRDCKSLDPEVREQHFNNKLNRDFAELVRHTESTIEHVLEDPPGFFGIFSWIGIARGFVGKAGELKRKRDESGIKSPVGSEYYANARIFYRNILDKAELAEQKYEQDRPSLDVTRRAVNDICTILVDSVSSSPTSSFLDWSGATVGGRDLDEHLADVLGKLSHHGFGTVLSVIRKIMKLYD